MDKLENVKKAFAESDQHCSGKIRKEKCMSLFKDLFGWSQQELDDLFGAANVDSNGCLDYNKFIDWCYAAYDPSRITRFGFNDLIAGVEVKDFGWSVEAPSLIVQSVEPNGWASKKGIEAGDVLCEVGGIPVSELRNDDFRLMQRHRPFHCRVAFRKQVKAALKIQSSERGRRARKRVARIQFAKHVAIKTLPLPSVHLAKSLVKKVAGDRVPILVAGAQTLEDSFNDLQLELLEKIMSAMADSSILQRRAVLIGTSIHARAPHGAFARWRLRGCAFDNIIQELAFRAMPQRTVMLAFGTEAANWTVEGPEEKIIKLGNPNGIIHNGPGNKEDKVSVFTVRTPDVSSLPEAPPQEWFGVQCLPSISLIFGGDNSSMFAAARCASGNHTVQLINDSDKLTALNYPYKAASLFVFAAGDASAMQIMRSDTHLFRPPPVPREVWSRLTDPDIVAFFTQGQAQSSKKTSSAISDYASNVVQALEALVLAKPRSRGSSAIEFEV